jgi:hypothetical protein
MAKIITKKCKTKGCDNVFYCKEMCKKCYLKQYNLDHKDEISANQKQYGLEHKEERKGYRKKYRLGHKDDLKEYNLDHKDEISANQKQYRLSHKEDINKRQRRYSSDHKKERNAHDKQRKQSDPAYKLMRNASSSVRRMLKRNGGSKQGKSSKQQFSFTGDTIRAHIESLFSHPDNLDENGEVWMTWKNQGNYDPNKKTWHLDHIIPQSKLNFNSYEHPNFHKCWALENLRPLEAIKNLKKGNR